MVPQCQLTIVLLQRGKVLCRKGLQHVIRIDSVQFSYDLLELFHRQGSKNNKSNYKSLYQKLALIMIFINPILQYHAQNPPFRFYQQSFIIKTLLVIYKSHLGQRINNKSKTKISYRSQSFQPTQMEAQKGTPAGQSFLIQFQSHLLHVTEPAPGKISINFEELSKNLRHQIINYQLAKINYKTVVGSLKGQHPNILSATLQKNPDELFVLTIKVSYQFLPETVETIIFDKRQISAEESELIAVKNMKNYLQNIREQISSLTNLNATSGQIDDSMSPFEVFVKMPHERTVYTWGLNLTKPSGTMLKGQFYLYNSTTKQRKDTKMIPEDGVFLNHTNDSCYVEMRFFAEQESGFDHVIFSLKDKYRGNYLITMQKVNKV